MTVERFIAVYDKFDDSMLEDIQIELSTSDLAGLLDIDKADDPDVYKTYQVTQAQFDKLKIIVPELAGFDFDKVRMHLECFSIE